MLPDHCFLTLFCRHFIVIGRMWAQLKSQKHTVTGKRGFTIVELLIVIVVIGILAAITIVAFNGVQNKAKASAAQSAVTQANKKVLAYAAQNADMYPPNLAAADVTNTEGLQYNYNNGVSPRTYGITATNGNFSYYVSNATTQPVSGGYVGHGANGATAITNLATNPSFESTNAGVNAYNATNTWATTGGSASARYVRATRSNTTGSSGLWMNVATIEPGKDYTLSIALRGNVNTLRDINIEWINPAGTTMVSRSMLSTVAPTTAWAVYSGTAMAPAGSAILRLAVYTQSSSTGALTDYADFDAIMVTEGSGQYSYADGNALNWVWNGTQNSSTSTGSPL